MELSFSRESHYQMVLRKRWLSVFFVTGRPIVKIRVHCHWNTQNGFGFIGRSYISGRWVRSCGLWPGTAFLKFIPADLAILLMEEILQSPVEVGSLSHSFTSFFKSKTRTLHSRISFLCLLILSLKSRSYQEQKHADPPSFLMAPSVTQINIWEVVSCGPSRK